MFPVSRSTIRARGDVEVGVFIAVLTLDVEAATVFRDGIDAVKLYVTDRVRDALVRKFLTETVTHGGALVVVVVWRGELRRFDRIDVDERVDFDFTHENPLVDGSVRRPEGAVEPDDFITLGLCRHRGGLVQRLHLIRRVLLLGFQGRAESDRDRREQDEGHHRDVDDGSDAGRSVAHFRAPHCVRGLFRALLRFLSSETAGATVLAAVSSALANATRFFGR